MSDLLHEPPKESCTLNPDPNDRRLAELVLDGYIRREQLAQMFGLSSRTIGRWEALRIGPPRVCIGRTILYNMQSVREWLASREQRPFPTKRRLRSTG